MAELNRFALEMAVYSVVGVAVALLLNFLKYRQFGNHPVVGPAVAVTMAVALLHWLAPPFAGCIALPLTVLFLWIPLVSYVFIRGHEFEGDYAAAYRLWRRLRWLSPVRHRDWIETQYQVRMLMAEGRDGEALARLDAYRPDGEATAVAQLLLRFELNRDWPGLLRWYGETAGRLAPKMWPVVLTWFLRALGGTGDLNGLVAAFEQTLPAVSRQPDLRANCYLTLFVYCGRVASLRKLLTRAPLKNMSADSRRLWLAVAYYAAGKPEKGRIRAERVLQSRWPGNRASAERILAGTPPVAQAAQVLTPEVRARLDTIEQEWRARQGFPFSKRPAPPGARKARP